jgi:glutamate/tyrosine decarboxylase-like PLP-dependent enzyme
MTLPAHDEETLDPQDWDAMRKLAHQMIDDAVDHMASIRERPVWNAPSDDAKRILSDPNPPEQPTPIEQVYDEFKTQVQAYPMGNIHPRFWGWYMGAGNFTGALADFLSAVDGSNLGGGNTSAARVEMQVVDWFKSAMGFPQEASGTLTSGGSMANLVGLTIARNALAGVDVRAEGIADIPKPLVYYASDQAHSCHQKGLEILGLGAKSLRLIETDDKQCMKIDALKAAILADQAAGLKPACILATAGTTNTGALDDFQSIAAICAEEGMWFHVDGCIGALMKLAPGARARVAGIEKADSIALDPHKWLHTPFEAGCALVRDADRHFRTFEMHGEYLQMQERGIIAGKFLADYGFELSRSFKALKIWMSIKEHGLEKFGRLIDQNIAQARYLCDLINATPDLEMVGDAPINIVCFRYCGRGGDEDAIKALNTEIMLQIQESGLAVISDTTVGGRHALRVAINNHRTRREDLDMMVNEVLRLGRGLNSDEVPLAQ